MSLDRLGTLAGWALIAFAALYLAAHVLAALDIDPARVLAGAIGLFLAAVVIVAALIGRSPAR